MKTINTKISSKKINVTLEKTNTGFSAFTNDDPIFTTEKDIPELISNVIEAINLYFDEEGLMVTQNDLHFLIDFKQFFQYYKVLNAKFLAKKIGINETLLSQYVQGRKKPSERQTTKILEGIHQIGRNRYPLAHFNV
ncbi:MAG TPA: helix-turn-helix transcriptional regulator [Bacteroidales bacterium]|nr:helix-turn-helix transcriptional regulator [Bacteroidales bacterium]HPS61784.1 helix-turn-helix transcriptional regulator [Bacteroidales bacterium]